MQEEMKNIQQQLVQEGKHPVGFGIGINTGEVVVGNIGSLQRMDYTVIGDEVNLASRVQGVAKSGQILITESTYNKVKDNIEVNKLEAVKVKGKTNLIQIYEVIKMK
jgi:adenylate cyclase